MYSWLVKRPTRFVPVFFLALGSAFGFYCRLVPPLFRILCTLLVWALGCVLVSLSEPGPRQRGFLVLALALGLGLGTVLAQREEGTRAWGEALVALGSIDSSDRAPLSRLRAVGAGGRLLADSRSSRGGYRSFTIMTEKIFLSGAGITGECTSAGSLRVFALTDTILESGARLEARGRFVGGAEGPMLFVEKTPLLLRGHGGVGAALRSRLRAAFFAALSRAAGGRVAEDPTKEETSSRAATEGLLRALLAGDRDSLDPRDASNFVNAGCPHVLALSGQHLAIIAAAVVLLCKPLLGPRKARIASLFFVGLYVFMVGPGPALLRALWMYGFSVLFLLVDRPQNGRATLGFAFLLQLCLDPGSASTLGFQLSYLAVLGLLLLGPCFEYSLSPLFPPLLAQALAASLAAQAATAPLVAYQIGIFQPIGVFAASMTAPLVAAFMWWGLSAALLCGAIPAIAPVLAPITRLLYTCLSTGMALFARIPALELADAASRLGLSLGVVTVSLMVYARPYAEYRALARRRARSESGGRRPSERIASTEL